MLIEIIGTSLGSLTIGGASGLLAGVKLRGQIPLRMPSNTVRLENAQTDARIAELSVEQRKNELEREYVEAVGRKRIESKVAEMKQLTTVSEADSFLKHADTLFHSILRFNDRRNIGGSAGIPLYLRNAINQYAESRQINERI